jgi:DNA-directed RNA polymerase specialized sigma24 family protein
LLKRGGVGCRDNVGSVPTRRGDNSVDPSPPGQADGLVEAAGRLLERLAAGREPEGADLALVGQELHRWARRVFPDLDADDVSQSTMARLLKAAKLSKLPPADGIGNPWAYLLGSARYAALDEIRVRRRRPEINIDELPERPAPEDAIASLLDQAASQQTVIDALRACVSVGDEMTVRIIVAWLDLAQELGHAPVTREAAERAGVSHTSVATALKTFRKAVSQAP